MTEFMSNAYQPTEIKIKMTKIFKYLLKEKWIMSLEE